jgi:hypothetical protein
MCQDYSKRDQDLTKSRCGLRNPLHPRNRNLHVVHLVVNNIEELGRALYKLCAPAMIYLPVDVLVVNMPHSIIH